MVSNTKLSTEQKAFVKQYCKDNDTIQFFFNDEVTIMVKPDFKGSRMFVVSMSTMSPDEKKFRKSVGKYYAITTMENGQYVLMNYFTIRNFLMDCEMDTTGF